MRKSKIFQGYSVPKFCETTVEGMNTMEKNCLRMTVKPIRKPKRFRSAFTTEQISYLELQFKKFPYISCEHRKEIASTLNLQERAIKIWFQNRRMKEKKDSAIKETDYEITRKVEGQDRLINVCALPSGNEHYSHSLPVITNAVDNKNTTLSKAYTDRESQVKAPHSQVSQNLSMKHIKSTLPQNQNTHTKKQTTQIGSVGRNNPTQTGKLKNKSSRMHIESEFFESKKIKKHLEHYIHGNKKQNVLRNQGEQEQNTEKIRAIPEDLSIKKKPNMTPAMKIQKPPEVSVPYYPVMPSVFAQPYISSGGMIWKPVSIMPVMSTGPTVTGNLQHLGIDLRKPCSCNCHENGQTFTIPSNTINPYSQYMMSAPFPSPKF